MEEKLKRIKKDVQNDYEELKIIQIEKEALIRGKEKLLTELKGEELKPEQTLSQNSQLLYKKVFPLVQEIHRLEIRHKDIQHQFHLLDVHNDVSHIYSSLTSVIKPRRKGKLFSWVQELKAKCDEQTDTYRPDYSWDETGDKIKEKLGLCLSHQGLTVQVTISTQSCTHGDSCSEAECISLAAGTSVTCDVHIEGLQDHTSHLVQQQAPVSCLIAFIHRALEGDVLPYL